MIEQQAIYFRPFDVPAAFFTVSTLCCLHYKIGLWE